MPSFSLHTATIHPHPTSWKLLGTHPTTPSNQKLFLRRVLAFSSLRVRASSSSDGGVEKGSKQIGLLPFEVRSPTKISRFFWKGDDLQSVTVTVDGGAANRDAGLFRDFFIPTQVTGNYLHYAKWMLLHRVFSSALEVLATQAMFRALGIGHSLPLAAALNWLLKDYLGRLSRHIYTVMLASTFDAHLKRVRFATSVLFVASIGLELLTPALPQFFLLVATIANIGKQISLACYLATRLPILQSFAKADNLDEISAKDQIQIACFDILAIMLAALVMWIENHQRRQAGLRFFVYPFFAAVELFGVYQGLKHVHLRTLTKHRILLSISERAEVVHIIMGLLQACYIRRDILVNSSRWENNASNSAALEDWSVIVEDGKRSAERDLSNLMEQMMEMGWVVKSILLSTQEQARYGFMYD